MGLFKLQPLSVDVLDPFSNRVKASSFVKISPDLRARAVSTLNEETVYHDHNLPEKEVDVRTF